MSNQNAPYGLNKDGTPTKKKGRPPGIKNKPKESTQTISVNPELQKKTVEEIIVSSTYTSIVAGAQKKKRGPGRPTKEEVWEEEKRLLDEETKLKQLLKAKNEQEKLVNPTADVIPIFEYGDDVKVEFVLPNGFEVIKKGVVMRQDVNDPKYVRIYWKDGSQTWYPAKGLVLYKKKKK